MTAFDECERKIWAGRADAYARSFARLCAYPVSLMLGMSGIRAGMALLDAGTGTGTIAAAACEQGAKVTAVDAEPGMVELAAQAAPGAHVQVAALPELPFADGEFNVAVGNFVLNHVGQPRKALSELRRVTRPGGRIVLTVWASPSGAGQALFGRALQAAGVTRPAHLPTLDTADDFPRNEKGFGDLLRHAGLTDVSCERLDWNHRATPEEWWSGPAAGVASIGQIVVSQKPETIAAIKQHYDVLSAEFADTDGVLILPHTALVAHGRA
ncbi:class I SAM-dependent methyltransferase [Streptomyces hokutonensis]|uniref:Class I SAM-dependent methyltransferase n=1 Tax=Streptomyces hokutonensis TaxID=1306990 RepID=A0ABW6MNH6_9ACTN